MTTGQPATKGPNTREPATQEPMMNEVVHALVKDIHVLKHEGVYDLMCDLM